MAKNSGPNPRSFPKIIIYYPPSNFGPILGPAPQPRLYTVRASPLALSTDSIYKSSVDGYKSSVDGLEMSDNEDVDRA